MHKKVMEAKLILLLLITKPVIYNFMKVISEKEKAEEIEQEP